MDILLVCLIVGEDEDASKMALYKLCLDGGKAGADAKYLLDSLHDESVVGGTLPTTFTNRQPFQAVLDSVVSNKRARIDFDHDDDNDSPGQDSKRSLSGGGNRHPTSGTNANSTSSCAAHQNDPGTTSNSEDGPMTMATALSLFAPPTDRDVANELDLLDLVKPNEQYEIVRSFASKHIVPYMTG